MLEIKSTFFEKDLKSLYVKCNSTLSFLYFATWQISC
jgi:hypothetical protein